MSAHPFLPWVYRGLVGGGRVLEDIDFRVKPAIFPVDNREGSKISSGDPQNRHRWTPRSSSPSPLLFFPPYRVDREEIFQRGEEGGKREEEKNGRKENASFSRRETTRGGWRGDEGEIVDPPGFYELPPPLPDYSFLIDARPPASFYDLPPPLFFSLTSFFYWFRKWTVFPLSPSSNPFASLYRTMN